MRSYRLMIWARLKVFAKGFPKWFGLYLGAVPIALIAVFALALAFYKINNKPFIGVVESAFKYFTSAKLYIWKKVDKKASENPAQEARKYASVMVPKISDSKLKDLTWSLDIKESMYTNKNQK